MSQYNSYCVRSTCAVHRVAAFLRCVAGRHIVAPGTLCHDTRPASLVTIQTIVSRHTPTARPCASALPLAPHVGRLCRGPLLAVSHLAICALLCLCHNTPCCIVTQTQKMGSSPANLPCTFFFFTHHFFPFVLATVRPQKKKYFFSCLQ